MKRPPHPATVQRATTAPHPATVQRATTAPHPATVQRATTAPHPATIAYPKMAAHVATRTGRTVQRSLKETPYEEAVRRGKEKYAEGPGTLVSKVEEERTTVFLNYYQTNTDRIKDGVISTEYKGPVEVEPDGNTYLNYMEEGIFVADSNHHAVKKGERALAVRTWKPPLSLSEIFYHHLKLLQNAGHSWNKIIKRSNVVNDETKVVFDVIGFKSGAEYVPDDDPFYALINTPNGVAAAFLIRDHGKDLGIQKITKIVLRKKDGQNMYIHFA
ncbi:hypothetical protein AB3662_05960 [Sorangium cellulosum]|uniref:hypothetical protein n=1 Tax=Sorangium cellulosum TaxID=56 RepID=UPI003D9A1A6D